MKKINPQDIRAAREAAGMSLKQAAEAFDYSLAGWQHKESGQRKLTLGEFNYLLLLADMHPTLRIEKRGK